AWTTPHWPRNQRYLPERADSSGATASAAGDHGEVSTPAGLSGLDRTRRPRWDSEGRSFWYGETLVRRYEREAGNQFLLLQAFEDANWSQDVESPLELDVLRQTIKDLNRIIRESPIRFGQDYKKATWRLSLIP